MDGRGDRVYSRGSEPDKPTAARVNAGLQADTVFVQPYQHQAPPERSSFEVIEEIAESVISEKWEDNKELWRRFPIVARHIVIQLAYSKIALNNSDLLKSGQNLSIT